MILDQLLRLRDGGSAVDTKTTTPEVGVITLPQGSGAAVVPINKTALRGLAVVVINTLPVDTGTVTGEATFIVKIESSDELDFVQDADNDVNTIATFPAVLAAIDGGKANLVVRRVHTQQKYVRSVIDATCAGTPASNYITANFDIFVGDMIPEED